MKRIRGGAAVDSLVLISVRLITALISIIIYKLLAVNFSLEQYGLYSQATLVATTVTSFTIMGMSDAINYFFNKDLGGEKGKSYVRTIIALQFIIGIIGAFFICFFNHQISQYFKNPEIKSLLIYVAFIPLLTNLLNMYQVLFISYGKTKTIALRNLFFSISKVIVVGLSSYIFKSIKYVLIGSLIIDVLVVIYMILYCQKNFFRLNIFKADLKLSKEILYYSIPMAAYIFSNALSRNIDKLVVGWFGDSAQLALYSIGAKELPFDLLTTSFITVLIPYITRYIAKRDYASAVNAFSKYIQLSYTITWIVAVGAMVTSKELMTILYDKKYVDALMIFCLYIIVDMIRFANTSLIFSAQGKTKELVFYSVLALVFNVVFNILFYKVMGLIGPAVATVVIMFCISSIMLIRSSMLLETKITYLINIKHIFKIFVECFVFGIIAYLIKYFFLSDVSTVISFVITYTIYGIPLLMLNIKGVFQMFKDINKLKMEAK